MPVRYWFLAGIVLLLQGCMTAPPAPPPDDSYTTEKPDDWNERRERLADFNQWELQGKVAVRHDDGTDSAVIRSWNQDGDYFRIEMSSSFMGMGTVRMEGSPESLMITDPDGETYQSADPEQLIQETLGWTLPVEALYYWIRGLPVPDSEHELFFDPEGRIAYLRQHGWELNFDDLQTLDGLPEVPRSLTATRDNLRLRLVLTSWRPQQ